MQECQVMHVHAVEMSVEPYCNNTEYAESIALVLLPTIEDVSPLDNLIMICYLNKLK